MRIVKRTGACGLYQPGTFVLHLGTGLKESTFKLRSGSQNCTSQIFTVIGKERRFNDECELSLFRIVQEALSNIRKHAQATEAHVSAEFTDGRIKLTVSDNGTGFELKDSMDNLPRSGKLGLMGMQERAWLLGGTLELDSEPGKGTTLQVDVPA